MPRPRTPLSRHRQVPRRPSRLRHRSRKVCSRSSRANGRSALDVAPIVELIWQEGSFDSFQEYGMLRNWMIVGSLASLLSLASTAKAQALPTALAKGELQVGGGYSIGSSDYGQAKIQGFSGFADYDILVHWGVESEI